MTLVTETGGRSGTAAAVGIAAVLVDPEAASPGNSGQAGVGGNIGSTRHQAIVGRVRPVRHPPPRGNVLGIRITLPGAAQERFTSDIAVDTVVGAVNIVAVAATNEGSGILGLGAIIAKTVACRHCGDTGAADIANISSVGRLDSAALVPGRVRSRTGTESFAGAPETGRPIRGAGTRDSCGICEEHAVIVVEITGNGVLVDLPLGDRADDGDTGGTGNTGKGRTPCRYGDSDGVGRGCCDPESTVVADIARTKDRNPAPDRELGADVGGGNRGRVGEGDVRPRKGVAGRCHRIMTPPTHLRFGGCRVSRRTAEEDVTVVRRILSIHRRNQRAGILATTIHRARLERRDTDTVGTGGALQYPVADNRPGPGAMTGFAQADGSAGVEGGAGAVGVDMRTGAGLIDGAMTADAREGRAGQGAKGPGGDLQAVIDVAGMTADGTTIVRRGGGALVAGRAVHGDLVIAVVRAPDIGAVAVDVAAVALGRIGAGTVVADDLGGVGVAIPVAVVRDAGVADYVVRAEGPDKGTHRK